MSKIGYAYSIFCDDNGLRRIDASHAERIENLRLMVKAAEGEIDRIENPEVPVSHWGLH